MIKFINFRISNSDFYNDKQKIDMSKIAKRLLVLVFSILAWAANAQPYFYVTDFGAVPGAENSQTELLQKAIDSCADEGGGTVVLPPGTYRSATLELKTNVYLHLSPGAKLISSRDVSEFSRYVNEGYSVSGLPVQIYANGITNAGITGSGTIDGDAQYILEDIGGVDGFVAKEFEIARQAGVPMKKHAKIDPITVMVFFKDCRNITLRDASFIHSVHWGIHLKNCTDVNIEGIRIYSSLEKGANSDGLDIDGCRNVTVSNCIIETGDDAIVLKTTNKDGPAMPCENIVVTNCVLSSTSAALKLGTESFADYRHIVFSNCVIRNTNRALAIIIRDGATAENILFSNITIDCRRKDFYWWGNGDPIWLVVTQRTPESEIGHIRNVYFHNIRGTGQGTTKIEGHPLRPLENIRFSEVSLHMDPEERPDKRAVHGFMAHHINGLVLDRVSLTWNQEQTEPAWKNGMVLKNISGLKMNQTGISAAPGKKVPAIVLENVSE
jgi:hypothetical protein